MNVNPNLQKSEFGDILNRLAEVQDRAAFEEVINSYDSSPKSVDEKIEKLINNNPELLRHNLKTLNIVNRKMINLTLPNNKILEIINRASSFHIDLDALKKNFPIAEYFPLDEAVLNTFLSENYNNEAPLTVINNPDKAYAQARTITDVLKSLGFTKADQLKEKFSASGFSNIGEAQTAKDACERIAFVLSGMKPEKREELMRFIADRELHCGAGTVRNLLDIFAIVTGQSKNIKALVAESKQEVIQNIIMDMYKKKLFVGKGFHPSRSMETHDIHRLAGALAKDYALPEGKDHFTEQKDPTSFHGMILQAVDKQITGESIIAGVVNRILLNLPSNPHPEELQEELQEYLTKLGTDFNSNQFLINTDGKYAYRPNLTERVADLVTLYLSEELHLVDTGLLQAMRDRRDMINFGSSEYGIDLEDLKYSSDWEFAIANGLKVKGESKAIDAFKFVQDNKIKIEGQDCLAYFLKNGKTIVGMDPIEYALKNFDSSKKGDLENIVQIILEATKDKRKLLKTLEETISSGPSSSLLASALKEKIVELFPYLKLIPPDTTFFGKEQWETYFGSIGEVPPIPSNMGEILNSPCPFNPGKTVKDTHMLVLIPASVNGKALNLNTLEELVKNPNGGRNTKYDPYQPILDEHGNKAPEGSYWVLMTKDVIPGSSRDKAYADQKDLVEEKPNYGVPDLLSAAVCILTNYVHTGTVLFSRNPRTYTRCKEKYGDYQTVVGGFASAGLFLSNDRSGSISYGVAGLRKFF